MEEHKEQQDHAQSVLRQRMNFYITTARFDLKYAYVAIESLFINNQASEIHLYIVSEDLTEEDLALVYELARTYGHQVILLPFDEEEAGKHIKIKKGYHWKVGAMSSYWLFHKMLPEDVDKIMVIESDTVTIGDLRELYNTDISDVYAACPGPEHKPKRHRDFMEKIGGDTLTFVLSMYNVDKIRKDFTLDKILETDAFIRETSGNSMMELTFGLLFHGKIKYFPGRTSCLDQNVQYMKELGYDYIVDAMKTAKLLHFSSYSDYGKPWNPVRMMPGYLVWWQYAEGSPYYQEYFQAQWNRYDRHLADVEKLKKNVTYRNILLMTLVLTLVVFAVLILVSGSRPYYILLLLGSGAVSLMLTLAIRSLSIVITKHRR